MEFWGGKDMIPAFKGIKSSQSRMPFIPDTDVIL